MKQNIRNIAIIAHVDHGKTTLVDKMLYAGNLFRENQVTNDLMLDNNELERERGITILSKNVSINYKDTKIRSTSSTPQATRTSAARWNACSTWPTAASSWSMLSKAPCPRHASCCRRPSRSD